MAIQNTEFSVPPLQAQADDFRPRFLRRPQKASQYHAKVHIAQNTRFLAMTSSGSAVHCAACKRLPVTRYRQRLAASDSVVVRTLTPSPPLAVLSRTT